MNKGARINAAGSHLRCRLGSHLIRDDSAASPGFDAYRRHHFSGVGTIKGITLCVSNNHALAGGDHKWPRPPGVMFETAVSTLFPYCTRTVKTTARTELAAASCWSLATAALPTSIVSVPSKLTVSPTATASVPAPAAAAAV